MKHFTFRLFLIRKLIESLTWSCIDEYTEFEEIADGLAKAHSAMEGKRMPGAVQLPLEPEPVEACRRIIKAGRCKDANVLCEIDPPVEGWVMCPNCGKGSSESWSCANSKDSAKRWLAEHGIKE